MVNKMLVIAFLQPVDFNKTTHLLPLKISMQIIVEINNAVN